MEPIRALDAHITQAEFGEGWPFSVPEGRVIAGIYQEGAGPCAVAVAFEAPDGSWYALNGIARSYGIGQRDVRHIWPLLPDGETRTDLTPVLYLGLNLAEAEGYWHW
jgi:hypothetical protein